MRELSLHILDLLENSIRANASVIWLTIAVYPDKNLLEIFLEDNGFGLGVPAEVATDPFYTTKKGKRIGLGLSLFREAVERADGKLSLEKSRLGGLAVKASMKLNHIDRTPMGDIAATLSSIISTNPQLDISCFLRVGDKEYAVHLAEEARRIGMTGCDGLALARKFSEKMKAVLTEANLNGSL
ncbi:MAG: ATP-binding protein [Planctomycetota bacterium]|nr:ATP-binding protein [Planctomycetota bacterium]